MERNCYSTTSDAKLHSTINPLAPLQIPHNRNTNPIRSESQVVIRGTSQNGTYPAPGSQTIYSSRSTCAAGANRVTHFCREFIMRHLPALMAATKELDKRILLDCTFEHWNTVPQSPDSDFGAIFCLLLSQNVLDMLFHGFKTDR